MNHQGNESTVFLNKDGWKGVDAGKIRQDAYEKDWCFRVEYYHKFRDPKCDIDGTMKIEIHMPASFSRGLTLARCNGMDFCESFAASTGEKLTLVVALEVEQVVMAVAPELFLKSGDNPLKIFHPLPYKVKSGYEKDAMHLVVNHNRGEEVIGALQKQLNNKMKHDWIRHRVPPLKTIAFLALHKDRKTSVSSVIRCAGIPERDIACILSMLEDYRIWDAPSRENGDMPETWICPRIQ